MGQEAEVKVSSAAKAVRRARIMYGLKPVPFTTLAGVENPGLKPITEE
jgi:hypothetical protein